MEVRPSIVRAKLAVGTYARSIDDAGTDRPRTSPPSVLC
jgi:hypothetical protein